MAVAFADFVFDRESRLLRRKDQALHIGPKAFDLLGLLLERRPHVVSKAQIRDRLWPATFVSDSTFLTVVSELRWALGDDAKRPRFVRTVYGRGYAFCGEAGEALALRAGAPRFRLLINDRTIPLGDGEWVLGRAEEEGVLWVDSWTVSRRHARITVLGMTATLEDLGSRNGTFLRGRRITHPESLADGDEIWLGRVPMILRTVRTARTTRPDAGA